MEGGEASEHRGDDASGRAGDAAEKLGLFEKLKARGGLDGEDCAELAAFANREREGVMKAQPLIAVRDVERSSRWYQQLLNCQSGHGGPEYEQIVRNGEIVLQLHAWDAHGHPNLCDADRAPHGFGVLLWFQMSGFNEAVAQARALKAEILEQPHVNPRANHREYWIRDPDGYVVVLVRDVGDLGRQGG